MSSELSTEEYEVVVVGGGPAGQTAALYSTRLGHRTALVDRGGGRAAMMQEVHNLIGVTEETSGNEFLGVGKEQLEGTAVTSTGTCSRRVTETTRAGSSPRGCACLSSRPLRREA